MISVDKFLSFIVPYADSVPDHVAKQATIKAANKFCTQTLIWQEEFPVVVAHPGDYIRAPIPDWASIVKYMYVSYNGLKLNSTTRDAVLSANSIDVGRLQGTPQVYYQASADSIRLVPASEKHGEVRMVIALTPSLSSDKVPSILFDRYFEAITNGALADIKQIQGQSYSDPQAAIVYKELFAQGVREAKNEAVRTLGRNAGRVNFQRIL